MHNSTTVLSSWTVTIARTLDQRGMDSQKLFVEAGLDPALLTDPNARYPVEFTTRLWELAVEATGDDALGLDVAQNVGATTFHALGYSLAASSSLKEAFERLLRYCRIVTDAADIYFNREGPVYRFTIRIPLSNPRPACAAIDASMAFIVKLCRDLYGPDLNPTEVEFTHPEPKNLEKFEEFFRAKMDFEAPFNSFCLDTAVVERHLRTGNPELARINDQVVKEYLARLDRENVSNRVHVLLTEQLPTGEVTQESVADQLHMSLRSLQRKLSEEDVTYKEVLDNTRRDLAVSYMQEGGHSINELTYLLGFADGSSFSRAFKRWTGKTPRQYRSDLDGSSD